MGIYGKIVIIYINLKGFWAAVFYFHKKLK